MATTLGVFVVKYNNRSEESVHICRLRLYDPVIHCRKDNFDSIMRANAALPDIAEPEHVLVHRRTRTRNGRKRSGKVRAYQCEFKVVFRGIPESQPSGWLKAHEVAASPAVQQYCRDYNLGDISTVRPPGKSSKFK